MFTSRTGFFVLAAAVAWSDLQPVRGAEAPPDAILWAIYNSPSYFTATDGVTTVSKQSTKAGDRLLATLIEALPNTQSTVEVMPVARILDGLAANRPVCFFAAVRTPERDRISYATPLTISPSVSVILRADLLKSHPEWKGGVNLKEMIRVPGLSGQYTTSTSFGSIADRIIKETSGSNLSSNALAHPSSQFRMLVERRIDYVLDYPEDLADLVAAGSVPKDVLVAVPINDIGRTTVTAILCPRSAWGLRAIHAIDAALQKMASDPIYIEAAYEEFPASVRAYFSKDIKEFLAERAKPSKP